MYKNFIINFSDKFAYFKIFEKFKPKVLKPYYCYTQT